MRLHKQVEYCLISLIALGERNAVVSAAELSRRFGIPRSLLAKLLQSMHRGGLIEAERGPRGGYRLRRPLAGITVREVSETLRGSVRLAPCLGGEPCAQLPFCSIRHGVWTLQGLVDGLLGSLSLAQLAAVPARGNREAPPAVSGGEPGELQAVEARA